MPPSVVAADVTTQPLQPNVVAAGSIGRFSGRFWILVVLTGVGAGLAGGLLMKLLRAVQHFVWSYSQGEFLHAVQHADSTRRIAVLVAAGLIAGGVAYLLAHEPGGHAGELSEAMWFGNGVLPFGKTVFRGCLSIVLVAMGASLGREAAPKQTGAAIAGALAQWQQLPPTLCRLLAACGAGAGMAAVYNVPFGGALFALEVLLGTLKLPLVPPMLVASLVATATSWLFLPNLPTYAVPDYDLSMVQVVWAALIGPLAGLAAVGFVRAISWADSRKPKGCWMLVTPLLVFAVLGLLALPFPQLLGNGRGLVQQAFVGDVGTGVLIAVLLLLKPLVTCGCLGSGAPGGLFTPTICVGALLGSLLGQCWIALGFGAADGSYALIGGAALLAAATQGPVSAFVLMVELTHHVDMLAIPFMVAIGGAVLTARALEARSIYSGRIHAGRESAGEDGKISAAAGYAEVLQALVAMRDRSQVLCVVDEHGAPVGRIHAANVADPGSRLPLTEIATARDLARR